MGRTVVHLVVCLMLAAVGSLCLWNPTPEAAAVPSSSSLQKESGGLEQDAYAPSEVQSQAGDGASFFVGLQRGASLASAALANLGLVQVMQYTQTGTVVLEPVRGQIGAPTMPADSQAIVEALLGLPGVIWAETGQPRFATRVPNDQYYPRQWGPTAVKLPEAWDVTTGCADVVVAVLDSGLAADISDFSGRVVSPYSTKYETSEPWAWEDILGHGSGVAAVALARGDDELGMAGAAWNVQVMPVHFTDDGRVSDQDYIEALYYAVDQGADVINISYGSDRPFQAEETAIAYAVSRGVVVVAAAGNGGEGAGIQYPAALPDVIAVGATDRFGRLASFSSTGRGIDVVAPGTSIFTYNAGEGWYGATYADGTSYSTPLVTGAAALLLSISPGLAPSDVESALKTSAVDLGPGGYDTWYGAGLLDVRAALERVAQGTTTTSSSTTLSTTTTSLPATTTSLPATTTSLPATTSTTQPVPTFPDVPENHDYFEAVMGLAREGIVSGQADGGFHPDDLVLRAQMAKMICGTLVLQVSEDMTAPFHDLGPDSPLSLYPHQYVAAAAAEGITKGTQTGVFAPWQNVSRAQAVTMIVRGAQARLGGALLTPPPDYQGSIGLSDQVHGESMRIAEYNELLSGLVGFGGLWDPWGTASRGEVAQVLWNLWRLR